MKKSIISILFFPFFFFLIGCEKDSSPVELKIEEQEEIIWQITNYPKQPVGSLAITSNGYLYGGTPDGIWRSIDSGNTWQLSLNRPINGYIATGPNGHIFATAFNYVFHSTDYGSSWAYSDSGLFVEVNSTRYVVLPYSIVVASNGDALVGTLANGIFKSTDHGLSWFKTNFPSPDRDIRSLHVTSQNVVFAGANFKYKVILRSADNGSSWVELPSLTNKIIYTLASDSLGNIWAGGSYGLYRSSDNGEQWSLAGFKDSIVTSAVISPLGYVYTSVFGCGVFSSKDMGSSWHPINSGLTDFGVTCLLIDNRGYLFVGTNNGIYRSIKSVF
jgi:ligand-binding sensor domain-containing protein